MKVAKEFRDFILRGNVVDLAVGIVIGAAFGTVVTALVKDVILPLTTIPSSKAVSFESLSASIGGAKIAYGDFCSAIVSFIVIAAVIFFFVVQPMNALNARMKRGELPPDPTTRDCPYCLGIIPLKATRCMYCTSEVAPVTVPADVAQS